MSVSEKVQFVHQSGECLTYIIVQMIPTLTDAMSYHMQLKCMYIVQYQLNAWYWANILRLPYIAIFWNLIAETEGALILQDCSGTFC